MDKCNCSLCKRAIDGENAALLTVSGVGNKRYLCQECEALLTRALKSRELDEIGSAVSEIGTTMEISDVEDGVVIAEMNNILAFAKERAEKIEAGEYDFAQDEDPEDEPLPEFENAEEEKPLSDEERAALEKRERISKLVDKITTWASIAIIAGVVIYFIIRMIL
jgi:hypothetical protein